MLYLSFKFVRKFKFCVSALVKRFPAVEECILFLYRHKAQLQHLPLTMSYLENTKVCV